MTILCRMLAILLAVPAIALATPAITQVVYRETSGTVAPPYAWEETYTVSSLGLEFGRTGWGSSTTINTGSWSINGYGASEANLFSDLSGSDVYGVAKTGEEMPPVGGGLKEYTLLYDNGDTRQVTLGRGYIYNSASLITTPVDIYIAAVVLPVGVSNRSITDDTAPPSVTGVAATSPTNSLSIPVTITAGDTGGAGVAAYLVTTSSTPPTAEATGWSTANPFVFTAASEGLHSLYGWAKDGMGNVSSLVDPIAVTVTTPIIAGVVPAADAVGVAVASIVTVTFAQAMDPSTITGSTVTVKRGESAVAGTVVYDADTKTAAFIASSPLTHDTIYNVALTIDVQDAGGAALASAFTWAFKTGFLKGDVNNDKVVDLRDAVAALQVLSNTIPTQILYKEAAVGNGQAIGMADVIAALQAVSSLRNPARVLTVTQADNGKSYQIPQGGIIVVELESNPSTGYEWAVSASDPGLLQKLGDYYAPGDCPPGFSGCGGKELWMFSAPNASQVTKLKMSYYQPWVGEAGAAAVFILNLHITGS